MNSQENIVCNAKLPVAILLDRRGLVADGRPADPEKNST